jgi:uncharacterized protein
MVRLDASDSNTASKNRRRLGLLCFFAVAFIIPWAGWLAFDLSRSPGKELETLAMFWLPASVSLAGFVASYVEGGTGQLLAFVKRVFAIRFKPWLWLVAALLPLAAGMLTFVPHAKDLLHGGSPSWLKVLATLSFANLWTGPLAEEFGWRGYLLPRFRKRLSPMVAGLAIGPIWSLWHLPLFYDSVFSHVDSALQFVVTTTAWSVAMAMIVSRGRGSVLPSVAMHFFANNQAPLIAALFPLLPAELVPGGVPFCVGSVVVVLVLAYVWRAFNEEDPESLPSTEMPKGQSV